MNANNGTECSSLMGLSELLRPRYSPGLLLRDDDLRQAVEYTRELNRLMLRSLFGCGVVCGLDVLPPVFDCEGKIKVPVRSGVALDCHGDPIHVPKDVTVFYDISCAKGPLARLWVLIRYTEKCCAPRTAMCADEDDDTASVCTRERDGYEIWVTQTDPTCACGCLKEQKRHVITDCKCADPALPCYKPHYDGVCGCGCGEGTNCTDCDCGWVVLGRLDRDGQRPNEQVWAVNRLVRRFVRPVLIRDPAEETPIQTPSGTVVTGTVISAAQEAAARKTAARKTAARKTTARKTAARRGTAPAAETPAATTPAATIPPDGDG